GETEGADAVAVGPQGETGLGDRCRIPAGPERAGGAVEGAERAGPGAPREPAVTGPRDGGAAGAGEEAHVAERAVDGRRRRESAVGRDDPRVLEARARERRVG